MKFFSSTPNSLIAIQLLSFLITIAGISIAELSIQYIIILIISFYVYSIIGISMILHRYYTHKSFKLNLFFQTIFTFIAVLSGRGSPLGWVYIHRIHHAFADTEKDPHSPHNKSFRFIGFKPYKKQEKINYFIIRDMMTPIQLKIDKYYLLIILSFLLLLLTIDKNLIFYMWGAPIFIVSITQTFFNYFAHKHGYQNFKTKNNSTNNPYLWIFILGDAWHNNHHNNAEKIGTKVKWFEFDPLTIFINLIKK